MNKNEAQNTAPLTWAATLTCDFSQSNVFTISAATTAAISIAIKNLKDGCYGTIIFLDPLAVIPTYAGVDGAALLAAPNSAATYASGKKSAVTLVGTSGDNTTCAVAGSSLGA
jgi:hypothetical protein